MPDEPDSWLYQMMDKMQFQLYEIGLKDNPNTDFAEGYAEQLKAIYEGEQLRRYLNGERVSIAGVGLFAVANTQQGAYAYDPETDVQICWDFNNEYRAVTWWQKIGKDDKARDIVACVNSFQMKGATVYDDALAQSEMLKAHKTYIYLNGDASGENKTAMATDSMWKTVSETMNKELPQKIRFIVPKSNPRVKDTIECVNWALGQGLIKFDSTTGRKCFLSMSACKADKYGEIDKSVDYKPGAVRTHEADTARYAPLDFFSYLYPGSQNRYFSGVNFQTAVQIA